MELLTKTREELLGFAKKLNLEHAKNITDDKLRSMIETEAIRKSVELEEKVRIRLQEESKMRREISEIKAEAELRAIKIEIPDNPSMTEIIGLKKKLNLMIKEPKPSPETIAIEASKKVYALFRNLEQKDMDVNFCVGGKYWFHFWPGKVHIIPQWLIGYCRRQAVYPDYQKKTVKTLETAKVDEQVERSVRAGDEQRFTFEVLGDAPDDASFGIVLDESLLSKLKQPV